MKAVFTFSALTLALAASWAAYAATADEALDEMKHCAVCKVMMEKPELMESMTWECHKVDAGMLCLATVPKAMKKTYDEVHKKMMENVEHVKAEAAAGRDVELCHFCSAMGALEKAGAKEETIDTATGSVYLVTATDPNVVAKIHAHADEAIAQQEAMKSAQQ
jgi:hypothetical protein